MLRVAPVTVMPNTAAMETVMSAPKQTDRTSDIDNRQRLSPATRASAMVHQSGSPEDARVATVVRFCPQ